MNTTSTTQNALTLRYDLVVFGEVPDSEVLMLGTKTRILDDETTKLKIELKRLRSSIDHVMQILSTQNIDLHEKYMEINAIESEAMLEKQFEEEAKAKAEEVPKDVKRLYRKLCSLTHPDRVKDPELHELFRLGKEMYAQRNAQGLEVLIKEALKKKGTRTLVKSLRAKYDTALRENKNVKREFAGVIDSAKMQIMAVWVKDKVLGTQMYRTILSEKIKAHYEARNSFATGQV